MPESTPRSLPTTMHWYCCWRAGHELHRYAHLRTPDRLRGQNVEIQEGTLRLAKEKLDAGLSAAVDVAQARNEPGTTQPSFRNSKWSDGMLAIAWPSC